jgi:hypothetical protein
MPSPTATNLAFNELTNVAVVDCVATNAPGETSCQPQEPRYPDGYFCGSHVLQHSPL